MPIHHYLANRLRLTAAVLGVSLATIVASEFVSHSANPRADLDVWTLLGPGLVAAFLWGSIPWLLTRLLGEPRRRFIAGLFLCLGIAGSLFGHVRYWTATDPEPNLIHMASAAFVLGGLILIPAKEPRVPIKYRRSLRIGSAILAAGVSIGTAYLVLIDLAEVATTAFAVEYSLWTATLAIGYWNHYLAHSTAWFLYALAFRTILQSENKFPTLLVCYALFIAQLLQGPNVRWMPSLPVASCTLAIQFVLLVRLFAIDLSRAGIDLGRLGATSHTAPRPSAISAH